MPDESVVVGLGPVDPALVSGVLGGRCRFVAAPGDAELGAAFGMTVLAYDPVSEPPAGLRCRDLPELAARSDVISLHVPLTAQTRRLVDRAFLAQVRPGAVLINCSRGGLIDTDAVLAALTGGRLPGVGRPTPRRSPYEYPH